METEMQNIAVTAPGQMKVIKRNGTVVLYDSDKIAIAMTKAFLAVAGKNAVISDSVREKVQLFTDQILSIFSRRLPSGGTIHIEEIQDQVELALMRAEEHQVARSYVLYREDRTRERAARIAKAQLSTLPKDIEVTIAPGQVKKLSYQTLHKLVTSACTGLEDITAEIILEETYNNLYHGVAIQDVHAALVMVARTLIEQEPNYTYVASRLLLNQLYHETLQFLNITQQVSLEQMSDFYPNAFITYIQQGITLELLAPELQQFDLEYLATALEPQRDLKFTYLGLQTLYDRYFIHHDNYRLELPQCFFMRVAMGLAVNESEKNKRAIEFYHLLSNFDYMSSTPTLFNAGTLRPQLSSCYLTTIEDDLDGIYSAIKDNALLSKWAGGLGNDWTSVRALGAHIKGTNGTSQGVVPFLKVVNDTAVAVNQGGKRKGAVCAYLETWHLDIEEFLELRKNTGDDRRRTHDMNTANWIPDLFMQRMLTDSSWTLFSPNDVPDLHDLYGLAFKERYEYYEQHAAAGHIKLYKTVSAKELWRKILSMLFETGHPWITFKDPCNIRSPQQHVGTIHSSNLCTEITLNTSNDEIAVCNLGSVNLVNHLVKDAQGYTLDQKKLKQTISTAIRMLDNVIDINYYAVPQAKQSNLKHRPIGLGIMGFQDALYLKQIPYSSFAAVEFADQAMESISYYAIAASCQLAQERGRYSTYDGSLWSQGILPIDSIQLLAESRTSNSGESFLDLDTNQTLNWDLLRENIKQYGIRNSNVMAIAPTATIANICGVTSSIEPTYQNLFVKSNLSGEFTMTNAYLVRALKQLGLWDQVMVNDLKYFDGSIAAIERIPENLKSLFATAFEIEPRWLIDAASRRQKWIDQAQSLNLYIDEASGHKLDITYKMAWYRGLKTTYYLRARGATTAEKSTISRSELNAVLLQTASPKACLIDDPECEACT